MMYLLLGKCFDVKDEGILSKKTFHIAIRAVLDFVEQSRIKYLSGLLAALKRSGRTNDRMPRLTY